MPSVWQAPAHPAVGTIIFTALGLQPLLYHRQWWIKAHVPHGNTKSSAYSQFIQPLDVVGVDLIIQ